MASIPVHSQGVASASPVNEDEELDKIMHEVGHELKKTEKAPAKHHFHFELKHHKKTEAKFSAQPRPVMDVKALPVSAPVARPAATAAPVVQAKPPAQARPVAQPKPAKPLKAQKTRSAPVMAILMTIIVTAALVGVAVYTYK